MTKFAGSVSTFLKAFRRSSSFLSSSSMLRKKGKRACKMGEKVSGSGSNIRQARALAHTSIAPVVFMNAAKQRKQRFAFEPVMRCSSRVHLTGAPQGHHVSYSAWQSAQIYSKT